MRDRKLARGTSYRKRDLTIQTTVFFPLYFYEDGIRPAFAGRARLSCGAVAYLAESLNETDGDQGEYAKVGGQRHEEAEHRVDEHADAQEILGAVLLRQYAKRYLCDDVAVEERAEHISLLRRAPQERSFVGYALQTDNGHGPVRSGRSDLSASFSRRRVKTIWKAPIYIVCEMHLKNVRFNPRPTTSHCAPKTVSVIIFFISLNENRT